jgi:seryl-tRNA synthetase
VIDLRALREDPDQFRDSQSARGEDPSLVDALLAADGERRAAGTRFDALRSEQKGLGKQVAKASGAAKAQLLARAKELADEVKAASAAQDAATARADELALAISNLVHPRTPRGGEEDFVTISTHGTIRDFAAEGIGVRDHLEILEGLGAVDMERGAKVSGSRFYFLTGIGALLELALVNLAMARATAAGLTPILPPALVKPAAMAGTGFLGQAAENVYRLEADDMYLVGTAEVPLAAFHADEIIPEASLPLRYAGYSPCFRREAGTYGKDTRGIFRVHWFDKVEMFTFATPETAEAEHERLLAAERAMLDALELPYRVIDVASGDLGASATRKFDCEAWIPAQGRYRELTSTSNCTSFQARRLRIRARGEEGAPRPLATLNGTLVAIPRTIIAIVENHQQADGSVRVPAALQPYLGGRAVLTPPD